MPTFQTIKSIAKDYLLITIGISLYAFAVDCFLLPYELATGGVAGIGALIYYATGTIEVQVTFLAVNAVLLAAAVKVLGWRFCMKTIYGVVLMTVVLWAFKRMFEAVGSPQLVGNEVFMACLIGAILEGAALSICFQAGGSTGGTDIIAAIVNKYRNMSLGTVIVMIDVVIISSCYLVFHDIQRVIFGFVLLIVSGITLDYLMARNRQSVEFKIYSRNATAIANELIRMGKGVTVVNGTGWYTKYDRKIVVCVVRRREQVLLARMIKAIDPFCFVTMAEVSGVWGEGFDAMKVKDEGGKAGRRTLVFATDNVHKIEEARIILGSAYEIRSLSDIGCDVNNPLNSDIQSNNAALRARFVKHFYGFDSFGYGNSLNGSQEHIFALATGNAEEHECHINRFNTLEDMKQYLDSQNPKMKKHAANNAKDKNK